MIRGVTAGLAVWLALGSAAAWAQPAPPPQPTPVPVPPPARRPPPTPQAHLPNGKPVSMYLGDCFGATVYVSSHEWRECCLLCSVGDDTVSKNEMAEYEAALAKAKAELEQHQGSTVVNIDQRQLPTPPAQGPRLTAFSAASSFPKRESAEGEKGGDKSKPPAKKDAAAPGTSRVSTKF